jgi:hypothetical protein
LKVVDRDALLGRARALAESLQAQVTVNANRRTLVSWRRVSGRLRVNVHQALLDRPDDVVALVTRNDREAWRRLLDHFRATVPQAPPRSVAPSAGYRVHDLAAIAHAVNATWFEGRLAYRIGWGRAGRPRRGMRFGSCTPATRTVRIHPALDAPDVPPWFVAFVVFHELLHLTVPPRRVGRRTLHHPPEFRAAEAAHPDSERARAWEEAHVGTLVRRVARGQGLVRRGAPG